jgi:SpoVK/Ycf46/Vps4 family AAA+-type ATPase
MNGGGMGSGESKLRNIFEEAKDHSKAFQEPCIILIDELVLMY